jgi:hypothetical protein
MYVEKVTFENNFPEHLRSIDLNVVVPKGSKEEAKQPSLFTDSVVFQQHDARSYMFLIKTIDENYKLETAVSHELGCVSINWRNYFGDPGIFRLGPFRSSPHMLPYKDATGKLIQPPAPERKEIEIQLLDKHRTTLVLEKPQKVTFRLHNKTQKQMKLQLGISGETQSDIVICGCYP